MTTREASCIRGALTAVATGDPVRNSICHCLDCKRATRSSDDGYWGRHHFCPTCDVTVWYEIERRFADPDFPAPEIEVYEKRRCVWLSWLAPNRDT